jgi:hypothetical protein
MKQIFGIAVPLLILLVWLVGAAKLIRNGRPISGLLMGVGMMGFIAPFLLPRTGDLLRYFELPAIYETTTIRALSGDLYAATMPLARVQRYSADGRFKSGWFVDSAGGQISIGATSDGSIVIAAARTRKIQAYDAEGEPVGPPKPYVAAITGHVPVIQPGNSIAAGMTVIQPLVVANPQPRLATLLLVPLWSPFVAWMIGVAGILFSWVERTLMKKLS